MSAEHKPKTGWLSGETYCERCGRGSICPEMVIVDGKPIPVRDTILHAENLAARGEGTEKGMAMLILALLEERERLIAK